MRWRTLTSILQLTNPVTAAIYGQSDNAGSDVRTVQLQNLLAGTRPIPSTILPTNPLVVATSLTNAPSGTVAFGDVNYVPFGVDPATNNTIYYGIPNMVSPI